MEEHEFLSPKKEILTFQDLAKWTRSEAYHEYIGFLEFINEGVKGKPLTVPVTISPVIKGLLGILEKLSSWIDDIPPIDQPQRFGNKAFKTWFAMLEENRDELLRNVLPEKFHKSLGEISLYLVESVGNVVRIDYGTGHEMSFVMFLYCVFRIGALDVKSMDDRVATCTHVFESYLTLVRKLQITYRMEPAGTHGSWSLDDFQFIPFLWGSSQLIGNPQIEPQQFTDSSVVRRSLKDFMFFGCIDYILKVKTGPFHEHSNQLWNISGAQNWTKVNQGLLKMYKVEVLSKFPVIQHTFFGSLFSITPVDPTKSTTSFLGKPRVGGTGFTLGIGVPPAPASYSGSSASSILNGPRTRFPDTEGLNANNSNPAT